MNTTFKRILTKVTKFFVGSLALLSLQVSAATIPTSGTCAMLINYRAPYGKPLPATTQLTTLALITFTSATGGTVSYRNVFSTYDAAGAETTTGTAPTIAEAFTLSAGTLPGTTRLTMGGAVTAQFAIYPVNGGQTILVQGVNVPASGVCQF